METENSQAWNANSPHQRYPKPKQEVRPMRDVVLQMQISFDGFLSTPSGDVEWVMRHLDDERNEFWDWCVDAVGRAGVHIMGGVTGRELADYWPTSAEAVAKPMNEIPKVVFSKTIDALDWNQTRVARGDLAEEITQLKREPGGYILVHGGARFAQSLSQHGLIDEYRLVVHPVVLGAGISPFPEFSEPRFLRLVEVRAFPSGAVLHTYRSAEG
jgi:dihydrofolate reductase